MSIMLDPSWAEYANAINSNYTDQSQSNPTGVVGGSVGSVHVDNNQSNETHQHADAGSSGYEASSYGSDATNSNETHQFQYNPTVVIGGGHIGDVDVHNNQSNETYQQADAHSGGYEAPSYETYEAPSHGSYEAPGCGGYEAPSHGSYEAPGCGGYEAPSYDSHAMNSNETCQSQNNPTWVQGGCIDSVHVDNNQSNATCQHADAGHDWLGLPSSAEASNFNFTAQVQANPTIVFGGDIGSVDVHNSQTNFTDQHALAHHA